MLVAGVGYLAAFVAHRIGYAPAEARKMLFSDAELSELAKPAQTVLDKHLGRYFTGTMTDEVALLFALGGAIGWKAMTLQRPTTPIGTGRTPAAAATAPPTPQAPTPSPAAVEEPAPAPPPTSPVTPPPPGVHPFDLADEVSVN